jgi:hypothetical protein
MFVVIDLSQELGRRQQQHTIRSPTTTRTMKVIVASLISLLFWATASAQDEPTFDFPKLTSANFDAMTEGKTVLLMCYAPWVRGV